MKLDFIQDENGAWVLEIKANSDFNLHLERASNYSQDVYLYVRGSSEGEYKLFKKLFGRVIDLDVDIPDAIVPKYYRIKCDSQPTLCEVTGDVENVTGVVVPSGGGAKYDDVIVWSDSSDYQNHIINITAILERGETMPGYTVVDNGDFIDVKLPNGTGVLDIGRAGLFPVQDVTLVMRNDLDSATVKSSYLIPIVSCEVCFQFAKEVTLTNNITGKVFKIHV